jgi:hypothetical protein
MAQSVFGVGFLFATPQGSNPTPTRFGRLQDVSVDFSYDLEQARGKAKIDLRATVGVVDPALFNNIYFGLSTTAGETLNSIDEAAAIPGTPYQVTVVNGATFSQDLGVYDVTAGLWKTRVASAPAAGQYAVNVATGQYTFAAADTAHAVRISYTYGSSGTGTKLAFSNQLMGSGVVFSVQLVNRFKGSDGVVRSLFLNFPAVQAPKLSLPLKLDDFSLPQIDMSAQDDGSGNVFNYSMTG